MARAAMYNKTREDQVHFVLRVLWQHKRQLGSSLLILGWLSIFALIVQFLDHMKAVKLYVKV